MKAITLIFLFLFSIGTMAQTCHDKVTEKFLTETNNYENHHVGEDFKVYPAGTVGYKSFDTVIELGYDFDVISFGASNEFWSGYGAYEIIVEPNKCEVLKIIEVYSE